LQTTANSCGHHEEQWQLISITSKLGAVFIGFIGWWLAPYTGLTDRLPDGRR
jgi:hypothetical protein